MSKKEPLYEDKLENYFIVHERSSLQFPLHVHSYIEFVHVLEGELDMQIGDNRYILSTGDMTVIFPNIKHDYHTISNDNHTNLAIYNCLLHLIPMHKSILLQNIPTSPIIRAENVHEDMKWIEHRLAHVDPKADNNIFVGSLFSMILCHCYPYMNLKTRTENNYSDITEEVISYVANHCMDNISLQTVAKEFGVSPYKVSRIFSGVIKTSFPEYVKVHRINNAGFMLANTDKDITSIAYECGFNNQQNFNKAFKECEGVTPSEYRKHVIGNISKSGRVPSLPTGIIESTNKTIQTLSISG
ncbi:MAG: AraC family transcriptional regulator [Lachnospiraceae bacterium]|nr:AraC family transcriptional regulator [Lachnospiraceae bacterium]